MSARRFRTLALLALCSSSAPALASVTDQIKWAPGQVPVGQTNAPDTLDDIWQSLFNAWALDPNGDADNDGCKNILESIAGTDPFKGNSCFKIGNMTISETAVVFTAKVEAGKKYRVISADGPDGPLWTAETLQTPVPAVQEYIPTTDLPEVFISIQKPVGSKKFYRLETSDVDSNGDGLSDWVARKLGLNPQVADSNGDGVSDVDEITQELQSQDVVTVVADNAFASEDGGAPGMLRLRRNRNLLGATITYTLGGNASAGVDFANLAGTVHFAPGAKEAFITVTPQMDSNLEGGELVTVTLTGGTTDASLPLQIGGTAQASVVINNTTAPSGTGLLARFYDTSNSTLMLHAANFGDASTYNYTRSGTSNYTGSVVVTPTGVDATRLATLLAALTVNTTQVRLSFTSGNLNNATYNHVLYTVTAKTAANFTCTLPPGASLPASGTGNSNFSIQPLHPPVVERVDATVDYDWVYGTPNDVTVVNASGGTTNPVDSYSTLFEGYLHPTAAGNYQFQLDGDDKARVLIDLDNSGTFDLPGEQIVEHGWDTSATGSPEDGVADDEVIGTFKVSAAVPLAVPGSAAQRYKIRVEHVETTGEARCRLQWRAGTASFANISSSNVFSHTRALTNYTVSSQVATINTAVAHGLSVNNSVVLYFSSGTLFTPPANYSGTYSVASVVDADTFTISVPGATNQASGAAGFMADSTSTTAGWLSQVFTNTTFTPPAGYVNVLGSGPTNANNGIWGSGAPDPLLVGKDTFTARWTGQMQPQFSEEYSIIINADDGCALWINGQPQALKMLPSGVTSGATYSYNATSGDLTVTYSGLIAAANSFVVGETVRLDPTSGNLNHAPASAPTYTYDPATNLMEVDATNLLPPASGGTRVAGSFAVGETVELDPTSGSLNSLSLLPYQITAVSGNKITVNAGGLTFTPTVSIRTISATSPCEITTATNHGLTTGNQVRISGVTGGTFSLPINDLYTVTVTSNNTFTVSSDCTVAPTVDTGLVAASGNITISDNRNAVVTSASATSFVVNIGAGKYGDASTGNVSLELTNKSLKDWSSNGSERYVRLPLVGGTRYDIQLDFYENTGSARCRLYWQSPSQAKQIIPVERLYPASVPQAPPAHITDIAATALVGGPFSLSLLGSNGGTVSFLQPLPPWLNYSNGILSGTPPAGAAGDFQIVFSITNGVGTSTSVINLHVDENPATVAREQWNGVAGTAISTIPIASAPSSTANLSTLAAPNNAGDDFGARIRGYLEAPVTGNYYFWLSASDSAEFWLSNDSEVVNAFKRATVTGGGTTPQNWGTAARSPWMALEAGKRYYFEILHKSATGDDHLALGWSKPGEATAAPSGVVPGYLLSPYVAPTPGSSGGTLYVATMLSQGGAITNGVGSATFRLSEDENSAVVTYTYGGLSGVLTDWHVHNDAFLTYPSSIMYDPNAPPPGSGPLPDNNPPTLTSHRWVIPDMVGPMTKAQVVELIKQGKAYVNLHTALYPAGEIRGNLTLANGSHTFSPPPAPPSWSDDSNTDAGAVRFLTQASFGANIADLTALKALAATSTSGRPATRYETWIDNQFAIPATNSLDEVFRTRRADAQGGSQLDETLFFNSWWRNSITGADQLRQRIAFALSQIHVISGQGPLDNRGEAIAYFYDRLTGGDSGLGGVFGNFRDILENTTLTPAMGRYLDMRNNDKPDPSVGRIPNENYAREIMQLFSVGLYRTWPDGTLMLTSDDRPIDTYTQREIVGLAHVFTGWTDGYDGAYRTSLSAPTNWIRQMREVPARHYTGPKRILNNEVLPGIASLGGQTVDPIATHTANIYNHPTYQALPAQELDVAHDQLFNHPNCGPFICRQLIQRLVTSHPSRDYLYRVVQKFNDNGSGVRGDMRAVIKAILLDYEARSPDSITKPAFGKQREPLQRVANAGRAFRPDTFAGTYSQSGTRTITVNTTDGGTPPVARAHKLATGNNILLEFAPTSGVAPWTGTYSVTVVNSTQFTANATGWATGTYSIPANSTTCTVTMTNHWLQSGNSVFMDFTSGTANSLSGTDQQVYVITHNSTANNGDNGGSFTITVPTDPAARSGNCMIPRFSPGSMTIAASGLSAPNDRRVTMRTEEDHHLSVGDKVQLNVYGTQASPAPIDVIVTVDSVVDLKTYTFLISSATTGWSNSQGNNSVYQFPLQSQPLNRSGNILSRSSSYQVGNTDGSLDQSPVNADTVFNFFLPEYKFPGSLASQGITTPEFQLTAETGVIRQANYIYDGVFNSSSTNGFSSFASGNGAITLDYSAWVTGTATDLGLGAPPSTAVPWTHSQNVDVLIDQLCMLLTADQFPAAAKTAIRDLVALPISSISTGNPCTVTTTRPHGYSTGQNVCISGVTNGTFSNTVNSTSTARAITVTGPNTFTFPSNCTAAPDAFGLTNAHASQIIYNQGSTTPSATERRDRMRAILHLILTSPDFTIQR